MSTLRTNSQVSPSMIMDHSLCHLYACSASKWQISMILIFVLYLMLMLWIESTYWPTQNNLEAKKEGKFSIYSHPTDSSTWRNSPNSEGMKSKNFMMIFLKHGPCTIKSMSIDRREIKCITYLLLKAREPSRIWPSFIPQTNLKP